MKKKTTRENIILTIGSLVILMLAYSLIFLFPTLDKIDRQKTRLKANGKNKIKLRKLLESHQKSAPQEEKKFQGSLSAFVEKKAKKLEIKITYIKPYGKKSEGVEIKIDEMTGNELLDFIHEMEDSGVTISRFNARDYKGTGVWVVKFNLEKG
ncbi:MAG: type II secretion system protein M [Candidatus Eremiobacteraeota bacterium]|nr:type II secretion system protein M [Candidatus Eremiobacteraeota bacterium]